MLFDTIDSAIHIDTTEIIIAHRELLDQLLNLELKRLNWRCFGYCRHGLLFEVSVV